MRILLLIFVLFLSFNVFSQEEVIDYFPSETNAEFLGGNNSMWCFIESRLNYDKLNLQNKRGRVFISMVIDTLGKVTKIETNPAFSLRFSSIVKDSIIEEEIKRVIGQMPNWIPAIQMDKKVLMTFVTQIKVPYTNFRCANLSSDSSVCLNADTLADFKFGNGSSTRERLNNFIFRHLKWPSEKDCIGMVYIQVIIECDGSLSSFRLVNGICEEFNNEAIRIIRLMPNWTPAIKNGKKVRSYFIIPVKFLPN